MKLGIMLAAGMMMLCSFLYGNVLQRYSYIMSVKYRNGVLSAYEIDEINSRAVETGAEWDEVPYITGWDKEEAVRIQNEELRREISCDLLEVYGDMSAVYPITLLSGTFVEKADKQGCLISKAAADKLFLSSQVTGCTVNIGKGEYVVKGVLPSEDAIIMIPLQEDKKLPYLELQYGSRIYAASNTKAGLTGWGLPPYESFLEGNLYVGAARILMGFPFLPLLFLILAEFRERIIKEKKPIFRYLQAGAACALFMILCSVLIKYGIAFSDDYIPSKASDFAFWADKYEEVRSDFKGILKNQMWYQESKLLHHLKYCFLTSAAASLLWTSRIIGKVGEVRRSRL